MKLLKAIAKADMLRPNAIDNSMKAEWLWELESEVAELMDLKEGENPFPNDCELLMPSPHDMFYYLHLCAMIDFAIEDTQLYVNDMTMANSAKEDAFKWWRRHHMKKCSQYIRAFPWQPKVKGKDFRLDNVELVFTDLVAEVEDDRITPNTNLLVFYHTPANISFTPADKKIIFTAEAETEPLYCDIIGEN